MQFLGKLGKIVCWRPPRRPGGLAPPPRGNPGSATADQLQMCPSLCPGARTTWWNFHYLILIVVVPWPGADVAGYFQVSPSHQRRRSVLWRQTVQVRAGRLQLYIRQIRKCQQAKKISENILRNNKAFSWRPPAHFPTGWGGGGVRVWWGPNEEVWTYQGAGLGPGGPQVNKFEQVHSGHMWTPPTSLSHLFVITAGQRSCGKVVFSVVSVCHSVHMGEKHKDREICYFETVRIIFKTDIAFVFVVT